MNFDGSNALNVVTTSSRGTGVVQNSLRRCPGDIVALSPTVWFRHNNWYISSHWVLIVFNRFKESLVYRIYLEIVQSLLTCVKCVTHPAYMHILQTSYETASAGVKDPTQDPTCTLSVMVHTMFLACRAICWHVGSHI